MGFKKKSGLLVGAGFLLGTVGVKALTSNTAKKCYVQGVAQGLRAKATYENSVEQAKAEVDDIVAEANFSTREAEVFALLMDGYTIRLISQELHISQSTVKTHISKIYLKTNVATREELFIKLKSPGSKEAVGGKKPGNA